MSRTNLPNETYSGKVTFEQFATLEKVVCFKNTGENNINDVILVAYNSITSDITKHWLRTPCSF